MRDTPAPRTRQPKRRLGVGVSLFFLLLCLATPSCSTPRAKGEACDTTDDCQTPLSCLWGTCGGEAPTEASDADAAGPDLRNRETPSWRERIASREQTPEPSQCPNRLQNGVDCASKNLLCCLGQTCKSYLTSSRCSCERDLQCPVGTRCVAVTAQNKLCLKPCTTDDDCPGQRVCCTKEPIPYCKTQLTCR